MKNNKQKSAIIDSIRAELKEQRIKERYTKQNIARIIGVGHQTITNFEDGKCDTQIGIVQSIADLVGKKLTLVDK